jgi:SAM-dependent methyltransferase
VPDLFRDKAADYDSRPVPAQISEGVFAALSSRLALHADLTVLDFGAGTGLVTGKLAPLVKRIHAVDVSPAMLEQLARKADLAGQVEIHCQNLLEVPLPLAVDLVVSAMAMHHVDDTPGLLRTLFDHLRPGGQVALADLDAEDGDFHPADVEGVFHRGFDRDALGRLMAEVGFTHVTFATACDVHRDGRHYPVFLVTATRPSVPA